MQFSGHSQMYSMTSAMSPGAIEGSGQAPNGAVAPLFLCEHVAQFLCHVQTLNNPC